MAKPEYEKQTPWVPQCKDTFYDEVTKEFLLDIMEVDGTTSKHSSRVVLCGPGLAYKPRLWLSFQQLGLLKIEA